MSDVQAFPTFPPPRDARCPLDPPADLLRIHASGGIRRVTQWDGAPAWLFTRHEDVKRALNDKRLSADSRKPGYPEKSEAYKQTIGQDRNLRTMDDPEHAAQKRMLLKDFSAARIAELRPAIESKVDALLDAMLAKGPPCDFVADFALAVPTLVICEMLGVPYADREFFAAMSQVCVSSLVSAQEAAKAGADLSEYMDHLLEIKTGQPANDLMSRIAGEVAEARISRKDAVELGRFVLIAGHETTANMIALSTVALLAYPEQAALLKQNPTPAFVANAVDELLRYLSITHVGRRRVAMEDLEIGGQIVRAGDGVILMTNISDRDFAQFSEADRLDLTRANAATHLAFGAGTHRCLGAALSKCELELVHGKLWQRIPALALAIAPSDIDYYEGGAVYGVRSLPLTWNA